MRPTVRKGAPVWPRRPKRPMCHGLSRRTGAAVLWKAKRWLYNSLPTHVLQKGWQSNPRLTIRSILQASKSRTETWQNCQSFAMNFTANGTTKSIQIKTDIVQVIYSRLSDRAWHRKRLIPPFLISRYGWVASLRLRRLLARVTLQGPESRWVVFERWQAGSLCSRRRWLTWGDCPKGYFPVDSLWRM
jgi:hypothetical protein